MKLGFKRGERGFTLVEIIVVLAVLAVLAAVVIPNVTGFLGRGKERGWDADRDILQASVDSYRTDIGKRAGNPWPTLGGLKGTPTDSDADGDYASVGDKDTNHEPSGLTDNTSSENEDLNSFIDIGALASENYLKSAKTVKSANKLLNTTANQTISGSYGWYINANGIVDAIYWNDANNDGKVDSGEVEGTSDFVTDVYP